VERARKMFKKTFSNVARVWRKKNSTRMLYKRSLRYRHTFPVKPETWKFRPSRFFHIFQVRFHPGGASADDVSLYSKRPVEQGLRTIPRTTRGVHVRVFHATSKRACCGIYPHTMPERESGEPGATGEFAAVFQSEAGFVAGSPCTPFHGEAPTFKYRLSVFGV
jgi:hypothetical protein